jgi:hypothetical protein
MNETNTQRTYSRTFIEQINNDKVSVNYDFAFGEYLATKTFFEKLSSVQAGLLDNGKVKLDTGQTVSTDTPGGLLAIQIYMDAIDSSQKAMSGLAKLGLNVEKNLWKNI